jgi:hypothetical protein
MDKTDGRRMLRAMKYSCVVVSPNARVLTASRCGGPSRCLCCWLDDLLAHAQVGSSTDKSQLCMYQFICSSQAKTDGKDVI